MNKSSIILLGKEEKDLLLKVISELLKINLISEIIVVTDNPVPDKVELAPFVPCLPPPPCPAFPKLPSCPPCPCRHAGYFWPSCTPRSGRPPPLR